MTTKAGMPSPARQGEVCSRRFYNKWAQLFQQQRTLENSESSLHQSLAVYRAVCNPSEACASAAMTVLLNLLAALADRSIRLLKQL